MNHMREVGDPQTEKGIKEIYNASVHVATIDRGWRRREGGKGQEKISQSHIT